MAFLLLTLPVQAGGPLLVGGGPPPAGATGFGVGGQAFKWNLADFPSGLTYWTDPGPATGPALGNLTAAQADDLVRQAFQVWQDVPTATLSFSAAGKLGVDVDSTNIMSFLNELENCTGVLTTARERSIIYDVDGSIVTALGDDSTLVVGAAAPVCISPDNSFTRGFALLNGLFIDGQPDSPTNPEISQAEFQAAFIHEFGHLLGLDHSQINLNCLGAPCGADDLQGLPTMFPVLISLEMATLAPDDIAAISALYPEATFATTTGRIQGEILFSDGQTPAQGFNVIAREVTNPRRIAVSSVSGFLFTADAGNPLVTGPGTGSPSPFGSRDTTLIGFYDIPGLPPGSYTVEVEAINNSGQRPFVDGSSVGPIGNLGFQFPLPLGSTPEFHSGAGETGTAATDPASSLFAIPVTANSTTTGIDIILNDTAPRFDAWESAWLLLVHPVLWARLVQPASGSRL